MPGLGFIIAFILILSGSVRAAEPTYKWRDERGGVTYGDQPPPGVDATTVDTQPNLSQGGGRSKCVDAACPPAEGEATRVRREEPEREPERAVRSRADANPRGLDFAIYIRLQSGMSEGELLQRAGPPDFQAIENFRGPIVKSYYYYPTSANPFTTIVTLRGGRIANIERIKKF